MFDGRPGEVVPKVRLIKVVSMESAHPHTRRYTHAYHRRIDIYIYIYIIYYMPHPHPPITLKTFVWLQKVAEYLCP